MLGEIEEESLRVLFAQQPEIIAHRGVRTLSDMSGVAPENTLPAFLQAADQNASIELDVIATRDGRLVVHHDDKTGRLFRRAKGEKRLQQLAWPEVAQLSFNPAGHEATVRKMLGPGSDYQTPGRFRKIEIPELETVLSSVWRQNANTHFYVELKTHNRDVLLNRNNHLEQRIAALIRQQNLYDRVTVISFSPLSLRKIKKIDPKIRTGWDLVSLGPFKKQQWALHLLISLAKKLQVDSLHPPYTGATEPLVRIAHRAQLKVAPYVSQENRREESDAFSRLTGLGVDGLITNAVDQLKAFLKVPQP
jgi:glycerophosphoryl diester phosphodiesterase